jgi:hypothetical protein
MTNVNKLRHPIAAFVIAVLAVVALLASIIRAIAASKLSVSA